MEPTIIVTANGVTAPKGFLDWLDRTEGGVNEYLTNSVIMRSGFGCNIFKLMEVALRTKYAEYVGYLQTAKELGVR